MKLYVNGEEKAQETGGAISSETNTLAVGAKGVEAASTLHTGYIGEIIVYERGVTDTERVQIERYLAQKWGFSI